MFERILVPLDGSKASERAIPVAAHIARTSGGTIVFVEVVLPPVGLGTYSGNRTFELKPSAFVRRKEVASSYLKSIPETYAVDLTNLNTELVVTAGAVSSEILDAARLNKIDLIVLCSHGETGLKRWIFGSVAQEAIRHSPVPVLILDEQGEISPLLDVAHPLRVLVPLDGTLLAESVILPAASLVKALSASRQHELHIMRVVELPPAYGILKSQAHISDLVYEEVKQEAETYMKSVAERTTMALAGLNFHVSSSVVDSTYVAETILQETAQARDDATSTGYDLIAMTTPRRSGLLRLVIGSVTEHVLSTTRLPLFIFHPKPADIEEKVGSEPVEITEAVEG